jgi:hypothetical protein
MDVPRSNNDELLDGRAVATNILASFGLEPDEKLPGYLAKGLILDLDVERLRSVAYVLAAGFADYGLDKSPSPVEHMKGWDGSRLHEAHSRTNE